MRTALPALAAVLLLGTAAHGQEPTVSPALARLEQSDTVLAVWFFGWESYTLDQVADAVSAVGGRIRRSSKWLHAVSADVRTSSIGAARERTEFRHLQPVARFVGRPEPPGPVAAAPVGPQGATLLDSIYGPSAMPLRRLNLFPLVQRGVRGAGVTIAILDTGFETELPAFDSATVVAQWDFVFDDSVVRNEAEDNITASTHGTQTWSLLAANVPTTMIGVAPEADYLLAKTEDVRSEVRAEEDNYVAALEWADSLGADVVSSSLGYLDFDNGFSYDPGDLNGDIAVTTIAADMAAQRGIVVVTAAGNRGTNGFRSLITPGDGDSVITVGAEDSLGVVQGFSSRGPTADGRLKPELMAPGRDVFVVDPSSGFVRQNGTSFSTPLVAGLAALIRQIHPTLSPTELREALTRTGSNRDDPDSTSGWGRPDGSAAAYFPRGIVVEQPVDSVLTDVTPVFQWSVPEVPSFVTPLTYRLLVAREPTFITIVIDTLLSDTILRLLEPQQPDARLIFTVSVTGPDFVTFTTRPSREFVTPPWATLLTLNNPEGAALRDVRPMFQWTSPAVAEPPGPFTYDVTVIRDDDGIVELTAKNLADTVYRPPRDLERNTPYRWQVTSRLGEDSAITESQGIFLIIDDSAPRVTLLFQNFPNPFPNAATGRDRTCIWFDLATTGQVRLDILDIRGHLVLNLVPGENNEFPTVLQADRYGRPNVGSIGPCDPRLEWDGTARDGSIAPRGIYVVRLVTPDGTFFKRIVFMGR